jgi:hypothetical protein
MKVETETSAKRFIDFFPSDEIKEALLNEFKRRLIRYKMVNESLKKKYGMTFTDFEFLKIVEKHNFSWEVESDAMEWEHALEGIEHAIKRLKEIGEA